MIAFLLIEAALAVTIRDNLFLIVLQLLYPIDKIKKWQNEVLPDRYQYKIDAADDAAEIKEEEDIDLSAGQLQSSSSSSKYSKYKVQER